MRPAGPPGGVARRRALLLAVCAAASAAVAALPTPCVAGNLACANGGVCMFDDAAGTYCECASGYAGALCGQLVGAGMGCTRNGSLVAYCMNGGLCPSSNVSTSFCDCSTVPTDAAGNTFRCAHVSPGGGDRDLSLRPRLTRGAAARTASSRRCSALARRRRA